MVLSVSESANRLLAEEARRAACIRRPPIEGAGGRAGVQGREVQRPWWLDFPLNGQYFTYPGVIDTPALGTTLAVIQSFTVPAGWDGVIRKVSHNYTGPGFVQGSGDLAFAIRVAGAMIKNYSNILVEFGSPQQPRDTFIIVREAQLVEYLVSVDAAAAIPIAGTFINAFMDGWFVPRGA